MKKFTITTVWVLLLSMAAVQAHAGGIGLDSAGLFDSILTRFANTASGWKGTMVKYGTWLFWGLTLISMVWTYGLMALKKADIQEFLAETVGFMVTTGFFLWILLNGPAISMAIIDSMRQIAAEASGLSRGVSPSGIVDIGFDVLAKVVDKSSIWSPSSSIVGLFVAGIILVVLALVAVNLLIVLISAWLLAYGGIFLLGFGGGRWTQDIAIQYYKQVLGVAVQTFAMILIVGIGRSFIDQYYAALGNDMALKELFVMLVVAIILLALVNKIPPMLAGIVSGGGGGGGFGGGMGSFGAGAAVGAAAMGAAAAASTASAALGAGSSAAGGASAIKAAFQAAQQSMASGGGGGFGGGSGGGSSSGGLASAMGTAGRFATDMSSSLAKGAGQAIKDKMDSVKSAASEKIASTVGGKIADAINNRSQEGSGGGSASPTASNDNSVDFDGDSLSKGARADGVNDEVSDFMNKTASNDTRAD